MFNSGVRGAIAHRQSSVTGEWYDGIAISVITTANTEDRFASLRRLLASLLTADYSALNEGEGVRLHISMDQRTMPAVVAYVSAFEWPYGKKTTHRRIKTAGLIAAVAESWYPGTKDEVGILLEDDIEVSPFYFRWVKEALAVASPYEDASIMGVSLFTPRRVEVFKDPDSRKPLKFNFNPSIFMDLLTGDSTAPYLHQLPCSWGAVFYAQPWREFIEYMSLRLVAEAASAEEYPDKKLPSSHLAMPLPVSSTPGWKASWKKYLIELMVAKGWFMLYPSYPRQVSFSTNHLEVGEHIKEGDTQHGAVDYTVPLVQEWTIRMVEEHRGAILRKSADAIAIPIPVAELPRLNLVNVPLTTLDYLRAMHGDGDGVSDDLSYTFWSPWRWGPVSYQVAIGRQTTDDVVASRLMAKVAYGNAFNYGGTRETLEQCWQSRDRKCKDFCGATNELLVNAARVTVLLATFDRFDVLSMQIEHYTRSERVARVLVTWHDINRPPPPPMVVNQVMVEFLPQTCDSLNNRFTPSMLIATEAVLVLDDDMKVHLEDIDLLHETWLHHQSNIVGFFPRRIVNGKYNQYGADLFSGPYEMMLTKAMMLHRRYLEAYTCNTDLMRDVHSYVDSKMNCEDIAMNFLVANTNGRCPVPLFVEPLHFIGDFGDIRYAQRDGIKAPIHQRGLAIPGAGRRRRPLGDNTHTDERSDCYHFFRDHFNLDSGGGGGLLQQHHKVRTRILSASEMDPARLARLVEEGAPREARFVEMALVKVSPPGAAHLEQFTVYCGYDASGGKRGAAAWYTTGHGWKRDGATAPRAQLASDYRLACDFSAEAAAAQADVSRRRPLIFFWTAIDGVASQGRRDATVGEGN